MGRIGEAEFQEKLLKMVKACEGALEEIKTWRLENEKMKSLRFTNIEEENREKKVTAAAGKEGKRENAEEAKVADDAEGEDEGDDDGSGIGRRRTNRSGTSRETARPQTVAGTAAQGAQASGVAAQWRSLTKTCCLPDVLDQGQPKETEKGKGQNEEKEEGAEQRTKEEEKKEEEKEGNLTLKLLREREEEGANVVLQGLDLFFDLMGQAQKTFMLKEKRMGSIVPINITSAIMMGQGQILEMMKFELELKKLLGQRKGQLHRPTLKQQGTDRNVVLNAQKAEISLYFSVIFNGAMGSSGNFSISSITGSICFKLWDPGGIYPILPALFPHLEDKVNFKGGSIDGPSINIQAH